MSESVSTKKMIADGFKQLMDKKPFEKITIAEIADCCGLNRQTFYYHFQDKYELLNWILFTDVIEPFSDGLTINNWSDRLLSILLKIKRDGRFYSNAMSTSHGEEFRRYLFGAVTNVLCEIIDQITEERTIKPSDRKFIAEFFAYGVSGTVTRWVVNGMKEDPQETAVYLKNLINDFKMFAVERYASKK